MLCFRFCSYYELEADEYARKGISLSPDVWLVKLMVGAIDPTCAFAVAAGLRHG